MILKILNKLIYKTGFYIILKKELTFLKNIPKFSYLWEQLDDDQKTFISKYLVHSKSQFGQDLFVLSQVCKKNIAPFFVEFGATDGVALSNSYVFEKHLQWDGILSEPAKSWHEKLQINRSCKIDIRCVYSNSNEIVEFSETLNPNEIFKTSGAELSTIKKYVENGDWATNVRKNNSINYQVQTVSLNNLLKENNAPKNIGYLSIDTEGSELDILSSFDFSEYHINIITVEHNYNTSNRNKIFELLTKNNFVRMYNDISGPDDWYINKKN